MKAQNIRLGIFFITITAIFFLSVNASFASTLAKTVYSPVGPSSDNSLGPGAFPTAVSDLFTGAVTHVFPVKLPKTVSKYVDVSLKYNSSNTDDGPYGFGWNIEIGSIERNPPVTFGNISTNQLYGTRDTGGNLIAAGKYSDQFILKKDGKAYALEDDGDGYHFHAKMEGDFLTITAYKDSCGGIEGWMVIDKGGNVFRYGNVGGSTAPNTAYGDPTSFLGDVMVATQCSSMASSIAPKVYKWLLYYISPKSDGGEIIFEWDYSPLFFNGGSHYNPSPGGHQLQPYLVNIYYKSADLFYNSIGTNVAQFFYENRVLSRICDESSARVNSQVCDTRQFLDIQQS